MLKHYQKRSYIKEDENLFNFSKYAKDNVESAPNNSF
jgi:hypothetical protein